MNNSSSSNTGLVIGIVAVTVALFAGLVLLLSHTSSEPNAIQDENVTFNDAADPTYGSSSAPLAIHMYEDFECPACHASYPIMKQVMETYKNRIQFICKDFPLQQMHPSARPSANAARCAQSQGKFWEYQDQLFSSRDWVTATDKVSAFVALAKNVTGLNADLFRSCVSNNAQDSLVARTMSEGYSNHVDATPTFFVGKKRMFAMSFSDWQKTLDATLAQLGATTTPTVATSTR